MKHQTFKFYLEAWRYMHTFGIKGHVVEKTGYSEYRIRPVEAA